MKNAVKFALVLILSTILPASFLSAETQRIALVVGNAAYAADAALRNPVNDASDVAASLRNIGWSVSLVTDTDRRSFNKAIQAFRDKLLANEGANALFFYAGHGIQVEGSNYLVPVKAEFETVDDIKTEAVGLQTVTDAIEQAKVSVSLIILDACRNNPFTKTMTRSLGGTRGLNVVQTGGGLKGSAVMFSTSPGDVAQDGDGRNGIFTGVLLKYLDSDLKIEDLFKKVTSEVRDLTGGSQKPWLNASLTSDFYFQSDDARLARAAALAQAAEAARQAELANAAESGRLTEAAKTDEARLEAETAKRTAAEALAAKSKAEADARAAKQLAEATAAKAAIERNRPKGKARIESSLAGSVYRGQDLIGEVGPGRPLVADGLATGNQDFRLVSAGKADIVKSATITDKAYTTIAFGDRRSRVLLNFANNTSIKDERVAIVSNFFKARLELSDRFTMLPAAGEAGLGEDQAEYLVNLKLEEQAGKGIILEAEVRDLSKNFTIGTEKTNADSWDAMFTSTTELARKTANTILGISNFTFANRTLGNSIEVSPMGGFVLFGGKSYPTYGASVSFGGQNGKAAAGFRAILLFSDLNLSTILGQAFTSTQINQSFGDLGSRKLILPSAAVDLSLGDKTTGFALKTGFGAFYDFFTGATLSASLGLYYKNFFLSYDPIADIAVGNQIPSVLSHNFSLGYSFFKGQKGNANQKMQ